MVVTYSEHASSCGIPEGTGSPQSTAFAGAVSYNQEGLVHCPWEFQALLLSARRAVTQIQMGQKRAILIWGVPFMGIPQSGRFIMVYNGQSHWMIWGYHYDLGNLHLFTFKRLKQVRRSRSGVGHLGDGLPYFRLRGT